MPVALVWLGALALLVPSLGAAERSEATLQEVRRARYVMGTIFEITAYGQEPRQTAEALEKAFAIIRQADAMMSNYREDSDLTHLNQMGAAGPVAVPEELFALLRKAVETSRLTGGAFDATVAPLVVAWGQAEDRQQLLGLSERTRILRRIGSSHLVFDETRQAVGFDQPGVEVDLGAIAKGWAVDRAADLLRQEGIERALISAGTSTLYALGAPPGQQAWRLGIRHPLREDDLLAELSIKDLSLSTSASYERSYRIHGKTYSHILDPRTGLPVEAMLSCTVIAPTATESDALSTAVFVLGMEEGGALLRRQGLSGILASRAGESPRIHVRRIGSLAGEQRALPRPEKE